MVATIERVCRKQQLVLAEGVSAGDFSRYIEMAVNGTKSAYPTMQPVDAFLKDLEIMLRTLIAGAVGAPKLVDQAAYGQVRPPRRNPPAPNLEIANEHDDDQRPHRAPAR